TLQAFIDSNLWDEARVFVTPSILKDGIKKPKLESTAQKSILIEEDRLDVFYSK
ncbi:MAG: diaminohydroxyphosphoribosylaminopyrimidine deaminase, partial [Flavobacteriales bacterium]